MLFGDAKESIGGPDPRIQLIANSFNETPPSAGFLLFRSVAHADTLPDPAASWVAGQGRLRKSS